MDNIKSNEEKADLKKMLNESNQKINVDLFDQTLSQIEKTLEKLGEKIESKPDLQIDIKENDTRQNNEHVIDNTHLNMEELHSFALEPKINRKNSFGFYTYLFLSIGIIFAIYEILNIFKNLIILKFPIAEPYIEYFYEVVEILAYVVMNIVSFVKNLF
jgi:hypothetical protein